MRYTNLENAYEAEEVLILTEVDYSTLAKEAAADAPSDVGSETPSGGGESAETPSDGGAESEAPPDNGAEAETPSDAGTSETPSPENADWSVTYPVRVTNGFADFTEAPAGLAVRITANPAPMGQRFANWGGASGLTFLSGGVSSATAVFVMPAAPLYLSALYGEASSVFDDVEPGAYYEEPVAWAVSRGVTNGTSPTTFSPHDTCTRAQILTFLYRAAGSPPVYSENPFPDVSPDVYYYRPAIWAEERGLVADALFEPDTPCTRAAVMTYFWKLADCPTGNPNPFEDLPDWTDYTEAVAWAVSRGITTGTTPTTFEPERTCTRAQIATFLYRHLVETGGTLNQQTREAPDDTLFSPEGIVPF